MRIIYLPLEPYQERYTVQLSAPKTGWLERRWIENNSPYVRIDGTSLNDEIKTGSVLDACGRGFWATSQIQKVLQMLNDGELGNEYVIYFDDFWHPGISALPYAFHLTKVQPKMFAMLHAQSIDQYDFTYPMRHWMRHFEIGIGKILSGIFVTSTCLRDLCLYNGIGSENTVHITGLPYNSNEVKEHFPETLPERKNQVVFSSRWDKEKCPEFFLAVIDEIMKDGHADIKFIITTSAKELRSNNPDLLHLLKRYLREYPDNLELREGQTKEQYYHNLLESKVQFNCADQDFVSWTLLEATTCGCWPIYPNYLSFPEALHNRSYFMHNKGDVKHAAEQICRAIERRIPPPVEDIYRKYDKSWERMYKAMKGLSYEPLYRD